MQAKKDVEMWRILKYIYRVFVCVTILVLTTECNLKLNNSSSEFLIPSMT